MFSINKHSPRRRELKKTGLTPKIGPGTYFPKHNLTEKSVVQAGSVIYNGGRWPRKTYKWRIMKDVPHSYNRYYKLLKKKEKEGRGSNLDKSRNKS